MRSRILMALSPFLLVAVAACSSNGASTAPTTAPVSAGPSVAAPSTAPSTEASAPASASAGAAGGATIVAKSVGTVGTILVDGTSGMTLYVFAKDVKDSGTSACTGGCLASGRALTVPAGWRPRGARASRAPRDHHPG